VLVGNLPNETLSIAGAVTIPGTVNAEISGPVDITGPVTVENVAGSQLAVANEQFLAVSSLTLTSDPQTILLNSFTYPSGLSAANFHSAVLMLSYSAPGVVNGAGTVGLLDATGALIWKQTYLPIAGTAGVLTFAIPLTFGTLNSSVGIYINHNDNATVTVDIILDQDTITPAMLIAGAVSGAQIPIAGPPVTGAALLNAQLSTGSGANQNFGPTTAVNAKYWVLDVTIWSLTCAGAGMLLLSLYANASSLRLATMSVPIPTTAGFPAAGITKSLSGTFGEGGFSVPASGMGDLALEWQYLGNAPSAIGSYASALVGY
jgi:hypothetical protein